MEKMAEKYEECRQEVKEKKMVMIGMNAVALFLITTGWRTEKMKMKGFKWKKELIYIKIKRKLLTEMDKEVKKYLPLRKSNRGTEPDMSCKGLGSKEGDDDA